MGARPHGVPAAGKQSPGDPLHGDVTAGGVSADEVAASAVFSADDALTTASSSFSASLYEGPPATTPPRILSLRCEAQSETTRRRVVGQDNRPRPVPLSNRRGTSAKNASTVGLDRISVSFPVRALAEEMAWGTISSVPRSGMRTRGASVEVDGGNFFVGAKEIEHADGRREWWGKVEGNPSRIGDADGIGLCPVIELRQRLAPVLELVTGEFVTPDCSLDEARVKRLDVARDFGGVSDVPALLVGLARVHRPWSRKNNLYNDGTRNGAQTLMVGSGAGVVRLYDKFAETAGVAPEGQLRWETEARSAWLSRYGSITQLADVNVDSVEQIAQNRWRWSGMSSEVCTRNEVVARARAAGLSPAVRRAFLGWLMETACGYDAAVNAHTSAKYRKLARDLGVSLGPEALTGAMVGRLDWEQGTVVVRAA